MADRVTCHHCTDVGMARLRSTLSTVAHRSPMLLAGSVSGRPHSKWWWSHDIGYPLLAAEHSPCKGPMVWNSLLDDLRTQIDRTAYRRKRSIEHPWTASKSPQKRNHLIHLFKAPNDDVRDVFLDFCAQRGLHQMVIETRDNMSPLDSAWKPTWLFSSY